MVIIADTYYVIIKYKTLYVLTHLIFTATLWPRLVLLTFKGEKVDTWSSILHNSTQLMCGILSIQMEPVLFKS